MITKIIGLTLGAIIVYDFLEFAQGNPGAFQFAGSGPGQILQRLINPTLPLVPYPPGHPKRAIEEGATP